MSPQQAISMIEKAGYKPEETWADIGAGTGTFTLALREMMPSGIIYAVDKSPHALWRLPLKGAVEIKIIEGDFNRKMELPQVDNILMANTLHYASNLEVILKNILSHLKPGGQFILIEYETEKANPPWVPYPVPFLQFKKIAQACSLSEPKEIGKVPSVYDHEYIYSALTYRL